ncbi:hypothetical protein [Prescottella equi]|uniref:hypothetical protein n=1 Tax=Rhodococcus hoagii TaxID=43767 RepID=UPI00384C3FD7
MNEHDNDGLTLEQKRQIRQARKFLDEHQDEIAAAYEAADVAQNVEIPDVTPAREAIESTKDVMATGSMVEPVIEEIRKANLGKLRLDIADQIRPNLGGAIRADVLDAIKPSLPKFAVTPPTFKLPIPDLKVFTPPEFRLPASQLGFDLQKSVMPELPGRALGDMVQPMLDSLGIVQSNIQRTVMPELPGRALGDMVQPMLDSLGIVQSNIQRTVMPELPGRAFSDSVQPILDSFGTVRLDPRLNMPAFESLKAAYSWESVVPRIDLSAYTYVHHVAASVSSMVSGLADHIAPMLAAVHSLPSMITSLLDDWRWLADVGHRVARSGVSAALVARQAAINGETEGVEQFARKWLGIKRVTRDVLEAVVAALLEWSVDFVGDAIDHLGKLVKRHRRGHKLIGDTQLVGRRIDSLNREIIQPTGDVTELVALVAAPDLDFGSHEFTDPRCIALLDGLTPDEREIVLAKVSRVDKVITWEQAAQDCGFAASRGESVRRKVGRLKKKIDPEAS